MEIIDNKAVISETVTTEYSYKDLEAKIQNLSNEIKRFQMTINITNLQIERVNVELKKYQDLLVDAEKKGLIKTEVEKVVDEI